MPWGYFFHLQNYTMKSDDQKKVPFTCRIPKSTCDQGTARIVLADLRSMFFMYNFAALRKGKSGFYVIVTDMLN